MNNRELQLVQSLGLEQSLQIINNKTGPIYNINTGLYKDKCKQLVFNTQEYHVDEIYYACISVYLGLNRPLKFLEKRQYGNNFIFTLKEQKMKKKVVILSGAGISVESGIPAFRTEDGLWANHKVEEVCTAVAWAKDPVKVNNFYNMRRIEVLNNEPNKAHKDLAKLEQEYDVEIITTNVDPYHEQAGSSNVLHLHGDILKARSSKVFDWSTANLEEQDDTDPKLYDVGREGLNYHKDYADDGFPLRPDIVFFGESVPKLEDAVDIMKQADYLIIVGTSLSVYPAATLIYDVPSSCKTFYVDPNANEAGVTNIKEKATIGIEKAINLIKDLG